MLLTLVLKLELDLVSGRVGVYRSCFSASFPFHHHSANPRIQ